MLTTRDAKPHVFHTKPGLGRIEIARLIKSIETNSKSISDRTGLKPEAFSVKATAPLRDLLPSPKLRLVEIAEIDCTLSAAQLEKSYQELIRFSESQFSKFGKVTLGAYFIRKADKEKFNFFIDIENGVASVRAGVSAVTFRSAVIKNPSVSRDYVEFLISASGLSIETKTVGGDYTLEGGSGATIHIEDVGYGNLNPRKFRLTFSKQSNRKASAAFASLAKNPELKISEGTWLFGTSESTRGTPQNPMAIIRDFNGAQIPASKIEIMTFWTVANYRDFAEMEIIAKKDKRNVSLSLMEFEIENGRYAQLDISVSSGAKYMLWFSFDDPADAPKLSQLLGVKLEVFSD